MSGISKVEMAKRIVEGNPNATRKEIIEMFIDRLGMSKAGATTYAYNIMKGGTATKAKVKKSAPAEEKIEIDVDTSVDVKSKMKEERLAMMKKVLAKMRIE
jgi:hypothetical protein